MNKSVNVWFKKSLSNPETLIFSINPVTNCRKTNCFKRDSYGKGRVNEQAIVQPQRAIVFSLIRDAFQTMRCYRGSIASTIYSEHSITL